MVLDAIGTPVMVRQVAGGMSPYDRTVFRSALAIGACVTMVILAAVGFSGHWLFADAADDELQPADAVVVLGGEHDGRELYGIRLARRLDAPTVLLSNPYSPDDQLMVALCNSRPEGIEVICRPPQPATTRGEALIARRLANDRGWQRIAVVTWRFHLLRARVIFEQCYSPDPDRIIMQAVPKNYELSFALWEYIYAYQYAGLAKSFIQGRCEATL